MKHGQTLGVQKESHALNPVVLGGIIVAGVCSFKGYFRPNQRFVFQPAGSGQSSWKQPVFRTVPVGGLRLKSLKEKGSLLKENPLRRERALRGGYLPSALLLYVD